MGTVAPNPALQVPPSPVPNHLAEACCWQQASTEAAGTCEDLWPGRHMPSQRWSRGSRLGLTRTGGWAGLHHTWA